MQQFVATEDALNKAAEAKALCQKLLKRLHGGSDLVTSQKLPAGNASHNLGNNRHLEVLIKIVLRQQKYLIILLLDFISSYFVLFLVD